MSGDDYRPVPPSTALDLYVEHRTGEVSRQTLQSHEYRIEQFVRWCEEVREIDSMHEVDGVDLHEFRVYRREKDDLKAVTLQGQISTLRQFLRVCASMGFCDDELAENLMLPTVRKGEEASDEMLEAYRAQEVLEYLDEFHYASRAHVEMLILWRTSMRRGELRALDVEDYDRDEPALEIRHRPGEDGTPLKNGEWSERDVGLSEYVAEVLDDYLANTREDQVDENGRRPLITTSHGRVSLSTIKRDAYKWTRPCEYGLDCPHDRAISECDATTEKLASKCPSTRSPHAIRTGSVTAFLDEGTPKPVLGDRVDMTEDTMELHYDHASERERMYRRQEYVPEDV